jgi:ribosome-binding protein aMBF1 (putative translation factor)
MKTYTLDDHLRESLKDPKFRKIWEDSQVEFKLGRELIKKRLKKKMSQRALARKLKTTQATISRIETMQANPSVAFLKKIATALDSNLEIHFKPTS